MSDHRPELENHPPTTGEADVPTNPVSLPEPTLKREAIVMVNDRGRLGLLVALCSLAGVAVGFGLSSMASGLYAHHCNARINTAHVQHVDQVWQVQSETPPWLGVRIIDAPDGGAAVERVEPNSPANLIGIRAGDVIVGFARSGCPKRLHTVTTSSSLVRLVRSAEVGERVLVVLERDGESISMRAELQHMPRGLYHREMRRHRHR